MERDGALLPRRSRSAPRSGFVFDAKWRDSNGTQVKKVLGPAWVTVDGKTFTKRHGACPRGYLVPNEAVLRMRELIEERELDLELATPRRGEGGPITFDELADEWLDWGRSIGDWRPSTARNYESMLRTHLRPTFGEHAVASITDRDVRGWWRKLHDPTRTAGRRMSNRNANAIMAGLRAMLNWGIAEKLIRINPALGIKKHREPTGDKLPFFSVEEVWALVRTAEQRHRDMAADPARRERAFASRHDGSIFLVGAFTGLRRSEVLSLRWRHIDFGRRSIYVIENISGGQDARVKDHEGRTVPMTTIVAQRLASIRPDDIAVDALLFPSLPGKKLDPDALSTRYRETRDAAGLPKIRLHDLRHTFGSLAVDGGANLLQIKEWMGHSDIKTTMRYLHTKSRADDADLLDAAFGGLASAALDPAP
jgi:integrase